MGFAFASKLLFLLLWPLIFLLIFYFKDKEKFKKYEKMTSKDWNPNDD